MEGRRPSSASEKQCINKHSPRSYYVPSPMLGIVQRQGSKIRIPSPIPIPIHKEFTVCLGRKVWRLSLVPEEAQVRGKIRHSSSILSTSWTLPLLSLYPLLRPRPSLAFTQELTISTVFGRENPMSIFVTQNMNRGGVES